jgi:hypothetical protein
MWAVMFEIEKDDLVYDTGKDSFTANDPPVWYSNKEDAQKRADNWNTGIVVPYVKPMTEDERKSSIHRKGYL